MAVIIIPKVLRDKLTDEGSEALARILDKVEANTQQAVLQAAEGRFEKRLAEVKLEIQKTRADLIQWTFLFIFGQFWAIVGTLYALLGKS